MCLLLSKYQIRITIIGFNLFINVISHYLISLNVIMVFIHLIPINSFTCLYFPNLVTTSLFILVHFYIPFQIMFLFDCLFQEA